MCVMKDLIKDMYDKLVSIYKENLDFVNLYNSYYERLVMMEFILKELEGKKILDVGCVVGWYIF